MFTKVKLPPFIASILYTIAESLAGYRTLSKSTHLTQCIMFNDMVEFSNDVHIHFEKCAATFKFIVTTEINAELKCY